MKKELIPMDDSNEADMLNRIAFGMTAKQFREEKYIEKSEPIRSHLSTEEVALLDYLQHLEVGFMYSIPDFQQRKQKLEWCANNWRRKRAGNLLMERREA